MMQVLSMQYALAITILMELKRQNVHSYNYLVIARVNALGNKM